MYGSGSTTNRNQYTCSLLFKKGKVEGKGKAISLQAWTDPEVSKRLRVPDFKAVGT